MAVAQYLKPAVLLTCRRTKLAMQHIIATNVIRSFTFKHGSSKTFKKGYDDAKIPKCNKSE